MKKRIVLITCLFVLLNLSTSGQIADKTEIIDVSICALQENPNKFAGKTLRIKARYTASFESSWLSEISHKCADNTIFSNLSFNKEWKNNSSPKSILKFEQGLRVKNGNIGKSRSVKVKIIGVLNFIKTDTRRNLPIYQLEILFLE